MTEMNQFSTQLTPQKHVTILRRTVLFCTILISGGILWIPRELLAIVILTSTFFLNASFLPSIRQNFKAYISVFALLIITLLRPQEFDADTTIVRLTNAYIALVVLNIYQESKFDLLADDLIFILKPMIYQCILTVFVAFFFPSIFFSILYDDLEYKSAFFVFNYHEIVQGVSIFVRPDGFFFEPGVFQIYLNVLLFLAVVKHWSLKQVSLILLAVFCTQSTSGLAIAVLIMSVYVFRFIKTKSIDFVFAFVILLPMALIPIASIVYLNIDEKFSGSLIGSSAAREYDLATGLAIIESSPLIGIGFNHRDYLTLERTLGVNTFAFKSDFEGRSTTNGVLAVLYSLGIPLGLAFIACFFRQKIFPDRLLFGCILIVALIAEALAFSPFFLIFVFSGISEANKRQ